MTYNTIEELMNDLNSVVGNLNHKAEKKVLDEFYEDKRKELEFLKEYIKDIESGKYEPKDSEGSNR